MQGSGALAGSSILRLTLPAALAAAQAACSARDQGVAFRTLAAEEALELEAIAARILPTTNTPGAREAGVIHFFDTVLGEHFAGMLDGMRAGLADFQAGVTARHPGVERFSELSEADQDAYLAEHQRTAFFGAVRRLTLIGFFAMERYGGNRDSIGWKLIGFDGHGAAQPPFGYYDAEYMEQQRNGNR